MSIAEKHTLDPEKVKEIRYHIQELRYHAQGIQESIRETMYHLKRCQHHEEELNKLKRYLSE